MRSRIPLIILVLLACFLAAAPTVALAGSRTVVAQGTEDSETTGEDSGGTGQSDPKSETGSEQEATQEETTETGPPWTYQMARISVVLLVLIALAIGRLYYKLVASRQRSAA